MTQNVDMSRLRLLFILLAGISLLSQSYNVVSALLIPGGNMMSWIAYVVFTLLVVGLVLWGATGGARMGVTRLGRICGWCYVAVSLLFVAHNAFVAYYFANCCSPDDFDSSSQMVTFLSWGGGVLSMLVSLSMILFVAGSRVWMPIRVGLPVMILIVWLVGNCFGRFVYETITLRTILCMIEWLAVLVLAIMWPYRR